MNLQKHIWEAIPNYDNYKINQIGEIINVVKNIIIKPYLSQKGYLNVKLSKDNKRTTFGVHQLVAMTFLNHVPCGMLLVINHIDFDKLNNNITNLEIISNRENTNKKHLVNTSKYVGVCYNKINNSWIATISVNGKSKYLGSFKTEKEASEKYLQFLNQQL